MLRPFGARNDALIVASKPDPKRLLAHLEKISRERNFETSPEILIETQSYLGKELRSYGFEVLEEKFSYLNRSFSNLIARLGLASDRPRIILGAHFDSVPGSPGADDNASGVAALLEVARLFSDSQKTTALKSSSVEFAFFNLEEYGMIGSRFHARKLKKEKIPVKGMLSLEMVAYTSREKNSQKMPFVLKPFYPDVGSFIGLVADTGSKEWLDEVKKIFSGVAGLWVESLVLPAKGWIFPDARLSDHSPFWDEGFPALLVTDTSFYRNPYYHTGKDTIETLDLEFLSGVTEAVFQTALQASQGQIERR